MTTTTINIDAAERARRSELVLEARAAARAGIHPDERSRQREELADRWASWLHSRMETLHCNDPSVLLPDICARLEQLSEDRVRAALVELKQSLRETLK